MSQCPTRLGWSDSLWHIHSATTKSVLNDLPLARLLEDVVLPLRSQQVVRIGEQRFTPTDEMRVVRTAKPVAFYADKLKQQSGFDVVRTGFSDERLLPFLYEGEDCTDELLYTNTLDVDVGPGCRNSRDVVVRLCSRLGETARILGGRRDRPYLITDESDVRDLVHAVLKTYCDDVVSEEYLPKVAGTTPSRADISVKSIGLAVETKLARGGQVDDAKIITSLSEKLTRYACWPPLRTLVYLIYDAGKLLNPDGVRTQFDGPHEIGGKRFNVVVALVFR